MKAFTSNVGILGLFIYLAAAPVVAGGTTADSTTGLELLSGIAYGNGNEVQVLTLSRERAPTLPLKEAKQLNQDPWLALSQQAGVYEGTSLVLVESTLGVSHATRTLWKGRANEFKLHMSEAWFDGKVVRDGETGATYVIVLQGLPGSLEFQVFPVPMATTNTGASPKEVLETRVPQAKFLIALWSDEFCDSRKMDVSSDPAGLLITTKATDGKCRQIGYRFDPESGVWTQVSLKRIGPAKPKEEKNRER